MFRRIRRAVSSFAKAAMFELYDDGYVSLFEQLVACILSVRTRDEVSVVTARRLFRHARTAREMAALGTARIDELIAASTFHEAKAAQIHAIARRALEEFNGRLPCDRETLLSFHGVGPKCANLALGIACGQKLISVDIHVHRVTNRWGYVRAATPEKTLAALEEKLPEEYRVEINRLLVPFGKHICTGTSPKCSSCPVLEMCRQVGVEEHR
ncbi:MAG TPA: endonuclease III [Candidatus Kapabacteria bacterium]|nr:endonuclease III [Candidatus Kapabacteria bacterium]